MTNKLRQQVLTALAELSAAYPDWRFGQMIANLALIARGPEAESVWDMEDEELLAAIRPQLLPSQSSEHPLARFAGCMKDDPLYDEWQAAVADYRASCDADENSNTGSGVQISKLAGESVSVSQRESSGCDHN